MSNVMQEAMEKMKEVRNLMLEAVLIERAEIQLKYKNELNRFGAPEWVLSARKAELDFANAVINAIPNFIFSEEECIAIAKNKQYIHLCWVEWNTYAQRKEYTKGHVVNRIEDIMEIAAETIAE